MNRPRVAYVVMFLLIVFCLVHMAVYYPKLPAAVVSHFNIHGQADDLIDKTTFVTMYAITVLGTVGLVTLIGSLMRRMPDSMVNLPHKAYWLAPERRDATFVSLFTSLAWFANATLVLLIVIFHACFAASLGQKVPPWYFPTALGVYMAYMLIWCILFIRRFRRPREA